MRKLTWDDLLIEKSKHDPARLLEDWRWLLEGTFRPIAWSKFGDCFLENASGAVQLLDVLGGELREVATSRDRFHELVNVQENQEEWLLSRLVFELHERGIIPGEGECYALKIHPALGGKIEADNVIILSMLVWSSISGQLYQQLDRMPPGSVITKFEIKT